VQVIEQTPQYNRLRRRPHIYPTIIEPLSMALADGTRLGVYEIVGALGAGGMGEVYCARDTNLRREVAVKVLPRELADDPARRERLQREARAAASLNHANICTVYEVGEAQGQVYIAMELVDGQPLSARLNSGPLPVSEVLRYGLQMGDALGHAHERGVVHRDFKSANVMITPEGRAKVLDFGLAKRVSGEEAASATTGLAVGSLTQQGAVVGTLAYMAPEQLRGQAADMRSDVWALGIVLYEMAAGRLPFARQTGFEVCSAILADPIAPLPARTPVELNLVIQRCLEKEPARRYNRAAEVRAALEAIQTGGMMRVRQRWRDRVAGRRPQVVLAATLLTGLVTLLLVVGSNVERLRPWRREPATVPRIESLAVLPLSNLMGSDDQEYYVAATHEALIGELGKIGALTVKSRTSVMQYRSRVKPVPEIARELDVDALVEGSVFKSADRVRVRVLLIRARPVERELWSQTFDGELRNILTLQSDVARAIAEQIQVVMTPMETARLTTTRTVDPRAYDQWAKGWSQFNRLTVDGMNQCLEHTTSALSLDSNYAPAYALRASCLSLLPQLSGAAPSDAYPKAAVAARRALSLDSTNAEGHFGLAWTLASYDWDWPGAEREYRHGLELIPSSVFGHSRFGWFLSWLGRDAEAMEEVTRALQLNPTGPNEIQRAAAVHYVARRYDAAIIEAQRAIQIDPTFTFAYVRLGQAYTEKRMYEQAVAAMEKGLQLSGGFEGRGMLGRAYALWGRPGEARRVLDELLSGNPKRFAGPVQMALIYNALGQKDEALRWLEEAYRVHDGNMVLLKVFPAWDSLRSDPRFQDLLRRMNFP
jgi:serine/threonine-protein kinase